MTFDLRLKENFKIFLSGPSGCGKTTFIVNLIENINNIAKIPPRKIVYYFTEWQDKFNGMRENLNINFIEDNDKQINVRSELIISNYKTTRG